MSKDLSSIPDELKSGVFVYLKDVNDVIIQSPRYATTENFTNHIVTGYESQEVVLSKEVAMALNAAHRELQTYGFNFVVYDGYRPHRACEFFVEWSVGEDESKKYAYFPLFNKPDLFKLGFINKKSTHTRGAAVDLSIIESAKQIHDIVEIKRKLPNGDVIYLLDDGTVDMGCSFDMFHEISGYSTELVTSEVQERRQFLADLMARHGFVRYEAEWWHFTLVNEPYRDTYFDFPIKSGVVA